MRLSKHRPPSTLAFNITPMVDIVFLLIIFFMTVSQITRTTDIPLPLPRVASGNEVAITATVIINLTEDGSIQVAGQPLARAGLLESLARRIQKLDNDPQRIKIQLRIHRNCASRHVTELLQALAELGFINVRSAVTDQ